VPEGGERSTLIATPAAPERRRYERAAVRGVTASLTVVVDADILDISISGALVRCRCELRVGDRARLQTVLQREAFVTDMSVVRTVAASRRVPTSTCAGVEFLDQDEGSVKSLRRLLSHDAPGDRLGQVSEQDRLQKGST